MDNFLAAKMQQKFRYKMNVHLSLETRTLIVNYVLFSSLDIVLVHGAGLARY